MDHQDEISLQSSNKQANATASTHAFSSRQRARYGTLTGLSASSPAVSSAAQEHGTSKKSSSRRTRHQKRRQTISTNQSSRLRLNITARCLFLACIWGVACAGLIVHVLGPPGHATHEPDEGMRSVGIEGGVTPIFMDGLNGSTFPDWTSTGHHTRFLGQKAFPELFEGWMEGNEGQYNNILTINKVDIEPLAAKRETLPSSDLLLAILSADTKECGGYRQEYSRIEVDSFLLKSREKTLAARSEGFEDDSPKVKWMRRAFPRVDYTQAPWTVVMLSQPSQRSTLQGRHRGFVGDPAVHTYFRVLLSLLEAKHKRDTLREVYDKYEGWVTVGGRQRDGSWEEEIDFSFRVVFVISDPLAPPDGQLMGDIFHVKAPDGYHNIVHKVKHMMGLVRHVGFKYLLKADDDTFVCLRRVADLLQKQPSEKKDKLFAGVPTACNLPTTPRRKFQRWQVGEVIKDPQDKWYDHKFVHHTLASLDCYPVYMQGAFYVLAHPLVEHLHRGREHYVTFVNEDVTIGSWLLGVDRALATIHDFASANLWTCACGRDKEMRKRAKKEKVFFHDCKEENQLRKCSDRLFLPGLGC